jgi:hypothetical protein
MVRKHLARVILSHGGHEAAAAPERRYTHGHVGRASRSGTLRLDTNDGHRGLGGHAVDGAREIDVEHRVTDHEDPPFPGLIQEAVSLLVGHVRVI